MTPLQEKLITAANAFIDSYGIDNFLTAFNKTEVGSIYVPFIVNGVIDYLIFDNYQKRFTKIRYQQGIGKGERSEWMDSHTGYFDEVEYIEIDFFYNPEKHG